MNIFSRIRLPKLGKNNFDLSYENKFTAQMGQLIPFTVQECVPGDQFQMSANVLVRFNPLVAPMMHRVDVYTHYFFVPNRLVWDEFKDFITGGEDGTLKPEVPYFTMRELLLHLREYGPTEGGTFAYGEPIICGSLIDYLGINFGLSKDDLTSLFPTKGAIYGSELPWLDKPIDAQILRAYKLIYDEYYRNQNTQPLNDFDRTSGPIFNGDYSHDADVIADLFTIRYRNWGLDYFTSALPFSQRGPETLVPVTGTTNVNFTSNNSDKVVVASTGEMSELGELNVGTYNDGASGYGNLTVLGNDGVSRPVSIDNSRNLSVDYDNASITVRELRTAERIQEFLERSARGGARYIEQIKAHFGVFSSDARLQRPEYLGGGKQAVQISSVDQTSATDLTGSTTPLGSFAGKAISGGTSNQFRTKEIEEHGYIIGIMSVLPKGGYHQGLPRKFTRMDKLDYFFPEFQNIGEQEIKMHELYFGEQNAGNPEEGFGYIPRYSEYKVNQDEVHGDFKTTLAFWHLNRKFVSAPRLNGAFSSTQYNIRNDIFAVNTDADGNAVPNLLVDVFNNIKARRPMLYYDNPSL